MEVIFPKLRWIDQSLGNLIEALSEYKPNLYYFIVNWEFPPLGYQNCNTNGSSKGNSRPSSYGFCIQNHKGDACYAQAGILGHTMNVQVEAATILESVKY